MAEINALQTEWSKVSLHSIPVLPSAPLCASFPQPTALGPARTGQPGKALSGEALSQGHGQGAEFC